jgi:hypothetical protein
MKGNVAGNCNTNDNAHTRVGNCAIFEGTPSGLIFTGKDASFSIDQATFNTEIKAAVYAAGAQRVIPIMNGIVSASPNGGDLRTSQEGFGPEIPNGLNALRVDYIINEGGECLYKQLAKLNKRRLNVFRVDNSLKVFGTIETKESVDKFRGYSVTVGVAPRISTGDQTGAIILSLFYSAKYEAEAINSNAIDLNETIEGLSGLVLKKTAAGKAKVVTACDGTDITAEYGSDLAEASLYKNKSGGSPTSVAYANGELTFTPAGAYKIVDALTLKEAGIEGYEGEEEYTDLA